MKKIISVILSVIMLACAFSVFTSAQWSEGGYGIVIADNVHYRWGPGTDYGIVDVTPATYGDKAGYPSSTNTTIGKDGKEWLSTDNGWICTDYITTYHTMLDSYTGQVNVSSNLAVRKAPTTKAPALGSLTNGTTIKLAGKTHFEIDGQYWYGMYYGSSNQLGWVAASYVQEVK